MADCLFWTRVVPPKLFLTSTLPKSALPFPPTPHCSLDAADQLRFPTVSCPLRRAGLMRTPLSLRHAATAPDRPGAAAATFCCFDLHRRTKSIPATPRAIRASSAHQQSNFETRTWAHSDSLWLSLHPSISLHLPPSVTHHPPIRPHPNRKTVSSIPPPAHSQRSSSTMRSSSTSTCRRSNTTSP